MSSVSAAGEDSGAEAETRAGAAKIQRKSPKSMRKPSPFFDILNLAIFKSNVVLLPVHERASIYGVRGLRVEGFG